jgi:hypothetical protein
MGWHIHLKNGKYAIWSTVIDDYITTWGTEGQIVILYTKMALEEYRKRIKNDVKESIERAKANKGCSSYGAKNGEVEIEERIGRMNRGEEPMVEF